jgi:DNA-binding winged helix-turn-helix (wHTH) protein/TolB-like protein/Tfp pilus assembly protein PilF
VEPAPSLAGGLLRFGIFELDPAAGELRRNGSLVRLPPQPFRVLQLLVQNPGEVIDRNRIRAEVWGDTAVDFDRSLNVCIAQIRTALNDDAESLRFIQTLPRRGYRFLPSIEPPAPVSPLAVVPAKPWRPIALAIAALAIAGASIAAYRYTHAAPSTVRIAVLPFDIVGLHPSAGNAQVEGIFDELLTRLGGVQPARLQVIGRRSVDRFREDHVPLREIGRRLDAGYAVEATVRIEGSSLRLAVRLADTAKDAVLWSETFSQEGEAPAFEENVVARVSAAVLASLFPNATPGLREAGCRQGWDAYRDGRLLANQGTIASMEKSLALFEQAGCAPARAARAETLIRLVRAQSRRTGAWEPARSAARQAIQQDPNSSSAHLSLANIALWHDWDWKTAEREFQEALRRNPSDSDAHHDFAWLLLALGRRTEGLASLQRALALDPLSAHVNMDAGWLMLQAGRFPEAAAHARRTLQLAPELKEAYACISRALLFAGDERGALEAFRPLLSEEQIRAVAPLPPGEALRTLFRVATARETMDPYQRAWRLAWVGARDEALAQLDAAFRDRSQMMAMVAVDPGFASLRADARFQRIVHAMGLD